MTKLFNIYLVTYFGRDIIAEMLWACNSVEEALEYAQKEWADEIEGTLLEIEAYEVTSVNGYKVQLLKEGE